MNQAVAFALWGAFGGFAVESMEFYGAIKRTNRWPWKVEGETGLGPLLASVVIRISVGCGLAWAATESGQVSGPFGAIAVGVAAPLLLEQMAKQVPVGQRSADDVSGGDHDAN
jgi:hypothetical protein